MGLLKENMQKNTVIQKDCLVPNGNSAYKPDDTNTYSNEIISNLNCHTLSGQPESASNCLAVQL